MSTQAPSKWNIGMVTDIQRPAWRNRLVYRRTNWFVTSTKVIMIKSTYNFTCSKLYLIHVVPVVTVGVRSRPRHILINDKWRLLVEVDFWSIHHPPYSNYFILLELWHVLPHNATPEWAPLGYLSFQPWSIEISVNPSNYFKSYRQCTPEGW